ncbi:MAG: hypothetical protein AAGG44_08350 [Planctomycetota bacterium]
MFLNEASESGSLVFHSSLEAYFWWESAAASNVNGGTDGIEGNERDLDDLSGTVAEGPYPMRRKRGFCGNFENELI